MLYFSRAKTIGILLVVALGVLLSLPNLWARPGFLPAFLPWNQVHLGLDLKGGSYLLLQLDTDAIQKQDLGQLVGEARQTLVKDNLGYKDLHADAASHQVLLTPLAGQGLQALKALQGLITYLPNSPTPSLAVAQQPDGSIALSVPAQAQKARDTQAVQQAITIIQRRIDGSGVLNPQIQRQGDSQIVVQLPGISDPERVKTLIGTTAVSYTHLTLPTKRID